MAYAAVPVLACFNEVRAVEPGKTVHQFQDECFLQGASMRSGLWSPERRARNTLTSPPASEASMRSGLWSPERLCEQLVLARKREGLQ